MLLLHALLVQGSLCSSCLCSLECQGVAGSCLCIAINCTVLCCLFVCLLVCLLVCLYCIVLYCIVCVVLCCVVLCCIVLYCIVLYCIVLSVLYCIVLYCCVLFACCLFLCSAFVFRVSAAKRLLIMLSCSLKTSRGLVWCLTCFVHCLRRCSFCSAVVRAYRV